MRNSGLALSASVFGAALIGLAAIAVIGAPSTPRTLADQPLYFWKGDVDCNSHFQLHDVTLHLEAVAGLAGVSAHCGVYGSQPGCITPPGPPSTNCDVFGPWPLPGPTSAPGAAPPLSTADLNCSGVADVDDTLVLLSWHADIELPLQCAPIASLIIVEQPTPRATPTPTPG